MTKKSSGYYLDSAARFGWGEESAKLDKERVALLINFIDGSKVLDVGCGSGIYVDYLSSLGYQVWGLDFVEKFIEGEKKNKKGNFVKGTAEKLPFEDNLFDTVFLFDILEHGDDKKILQQAKRVTSKRIIIIVPRVVDKELEQSGVIFRHYLDKSHLREYSEDDVKSLIKMVGLKLIYLKQVHPLYNETVFAALFRGPVLLKKIIRKIVLSILPIHQYPTEYFAVLEK